MPKNIEDIVPINHLEKEEMEIKTPRSSKRSIRDVPVPERRRPINLIDGVAPKGPGGVERRQIRSEDVPIPRIKVPAHRVVIHEAPTEQIIRRVATKRISPKKTTWIAALVGLLILTFAVLSLFEGATLTYTPASLPLAFANDMYTANKSGDGDLFYSVVKLTGQKQKEVPATGEQEVSEKARGTIVVFNEASNTPQKLIKNTRFETADGKVYRVQTDITVPGKNGTTPGSLEVAVLADKAGAESNIGLTDFTIPGLKGDPRYTTIYARSKTPMAGGFVGIRKQVSGADAEAARAELEAALREELIKAAQAQVPEDFILFPNLTVITFAELPQTAGEGNNAVVNIEGNLEGAMFKRDDLEAYLATSKISPDFSNADIPELENLEIQFAGGEPNLSSAESISFQINGNATLVLKTDQTALKNDLRGVPEKNLETILTKYPSIESANAVIRPMWKSSFPEDASDITLKIKSLK